MDQGPDPDPQAVPYGPRPTAKTEVYDLTPGRALLFLTGSAILVFMIVVQWLQKCTDQLDGS